MKLRTLLAASSVLPLLAFGGLAEYDLDSGVARKLSNGPIFVKSIKVENGGGLYGVSESVSIGYSTDIKYNREYTQTPYADSGDPLPEGAVISYTWGGGNAGEYTKVPNRIGVIYSTSYTDPETEDAVNTNLNIIASRTSISDPTAYYGENLFLLGTNTYKFVLKTFSSPKDWKLYVSFTNDYPLYRPYGPYSDSYTLGTVPCQLTSYKKLYPVQDDGSINENTSYIYYTFPCTTQLLVSAEMPFYTNVVTKITDISVGEKCYYVTNDVNIIVPSRAKLRAMTGDSQTKVSVITEN